MSNARFASVLGAVLALAAGGCAASDVRPQSPEVVYTAVAGARHAGCGVSTTGEVWCWDATGSFRVPGVSDAVDIVVSSDRACALLRAATVACWSTRAPSRRARAVAGLHGVRKLERGLSLGYALLSSGKIVRITRDDRLGSEVNGVDAAVGFSVDGLHGAAVDGRGRLLVWAEGGPRADSHYYDYRVEGRSRLAPGVDDAVEVRVGRARSCVRHRSGAVSCWVHAGNEEAAQTLFLAVALEEGSELDLEATELHGACAPQAGGGITCRAEEESSFLDVEPGFEAAYAVGAALGGSARFRQGLDLSLRAVLFRSYGGASGPLVGGHLFTGFGSYPTTTGLELGLAGKNESSRHIPFPTVTWGLGLGPEVRVDPELGWGASARVSGGVDPVQVGVRLIAIAAPNADATLLFTIGAARF